MRIKFIGYLKPNYCENIFQWVFYFAPALYCLSDADYYLTLFGFDFMIWRD